MNTFGPSVLFELSDNEKLACLREVLKKLNKILYVYDKSLVDEKYNYKEYCQGILNYIGTANSMFRGEIINVVVNLTSIISKDFQKEELKRIVFESKNEVDFLMRKYESAEVN